ncbi:MAG: cupredoxin domain-containing protein [Patescibacteria group bacterium]|nr:cupredoxin domain-containing protein [Patescibacteria group bacterium]
MSNQTKRLSLFILIVLVASAVGFLLYKRAQLGASLLPAAGSEHVVELREDGFHPEELTIHKGDTVTFVTKNSNYFWPASNLHPTHTIYPEFDPEEPIAPDERWGFRFKKPGEWKYHDHLAPYFTGKITVIDGSQARAAQSKCKDDKNSFECWQEILLTTLDKKGVEATFDRLAELYVSESYFPLACHYLTHNIGIAAYKHYLKDKDSVLTPKAAYCANGFYHGFMEAFLTVTKDPEKAKAFCIYVDSKLTKDAPDAALQCYHGVGHGAIETTLARWTRPDGGEDEMVKPALEICEAISDAPEELYRCTSGVFNTIANFYTSGGFGLTANMENPLWLCDKQPDEYKLSCYGNMNTVLRWIAGEDFQKAARFIEQIPDRAYTAPALRYLANMYTLFLARGNYTGAVENCRALDKSLHVSCIEGFAHGFLEQGVPGEEYIEAFAFCRADALSEEEREICFKYALNLDGWYDKEKVKEICKTVEEDYRQYCIIKK